MNAQKGGSAADAAQGELGARTASGEGIDPSLYNAGAPLADNAVEDGGDDAPAAAFVPASQPPASGAPSRRAGQGCGDAMFDASTLMHTLVADDP